MWSSDTSQYLCPYRANGHHLYQDRRWRWAYATIVKDLFAKDIAGWKTGSKIAKELAIKALTNAYQV